MSRKILKPQASPERIKRYWSNWVHRRREHTGRCFWCGGKGVLAFDLKYRGESRPRNLVCTTCFDDPLIYQWLIDHNWISPNKERELNGDFDS